MVEAQGAVDVFLVQNPKPVVAGTRFGNDAN